MNNRDPLPAAPKRPTYGRVVRYFMEKGWAHLFLLTGVGIFVFPFVWMVGTSLKTDEELTSPDFLPAIPSFRAASPYIRPLPPIIKPDDVSTDRWEASLPLLNEAALRAVRSADFPSIAGTLDREELINAASGRLVKQLVGKLQTKLWDSADFAELLTAFGALATPEAVVAAIDDRIARVELRQLTLRTNEAEVHSLIKGKDVARDWTIESGPAELLSGDSAVLSYRFASGSDQPVVLTCNFPMPVAIRDMHKLGVSMRMDDSWHQATATLDVEGDRWVTDEETYLAQHRAGTIFLQPPGFDDTTYKARTWIPLRKEGPSPASVDPKFAKLRVIITPSSSAEAIYGKVKRNYARAFNAVPFWTYVGNSLLLVALTVAGALFSASFVAYGFARLKWPGRSVAFGILLATMMLPSQVTMIPSFMIWRALGWYNTLNPLWVPAWFGGAFFVFLMVQHMKTIPLELEEAARIDGLNVVQTWWYIILPQVKPTLAAIAILTFMGAWNEFMGPIIFLRDQSKFPLSVGLFALRLDQGGDWSMIMAGNVLMTMPVIIIFFLFQRYFIQGMTMSGMKG